MLGDGNSKPSSYEAINIYNENQSVSGLNVEFTKSDESQILVENSANVNIDNFTIYRKSSESTGGTVGSGTANVTIDDNSKWIVTENSKISSLTLKGSLIDIDDNNVKVVDTNGNVLRDGSSEYVVTADNLS